MAPRLARHAAAPHPEDRAPSWRRNPRRAASCDGLTWLHNAQPAVRLRNRPPVRAGPLPGRTGRRRGHGRPRHARRPIWCERGDSNPHALQRQDLNLLRLPIPPPSRGRHSSAPRCRDGIAWRCHCTATKARIWIARWLPYPDVRADHQNADILHCMSACRRRWAARTGFDLDRRGQTKAPGSADCRNGSHRRCAHQRPNENADAHH